MKILLYLFSNLLKPKTLEKICNRAWPVTLISGCFLWGVGGLLALYAPNDYQHGSLVKIMFVHVPSSWWALGFYTFMAVCSVCGLILKQQVYFLISKSLAPVGLTFALISLLTGMLWGKPAWGVWWVWDARLTCMLILAFMYVGYIQLMGSQNAHMYQRAAFIQILGWLNIPLIKWSVDWWSTLHQPASITLFKSNAIHQDFLWPLIVMAFATLLIGAAISIMFLLAEIVRMQNRKKAT